MSRTAITGIYTAIYMLVFNAYIYLLSHGSLGQSERRLWYYTITALMTIAVYIDLKNITPNVFHRGLNEGAFGSLMANYILNIFNHIGLFLADGARMFLLFNGLVFAITAIVLISGSRHGAFKDE